MSIGISLVLVALFLSMNAFFVAAEFSLVRVRKSQIELAIQEGKPGAKQAMVVANNVNAYLSACQLGITLSSLALGWLGEPAFSALLQPIFEALHLPEAVVSAICVAIGYFLMTAFHVVAGELIPKSLAIFSTESYALFTAAPLTWFYKVTYPIMWLFNVLTNAFVRLLGHDVTKDHEAYTSDEIRILLDESTASGLISADQNEFVDNIFDFARNDVADIMTPRTELVCLNVNDSLADNLRVVSNHNYTRYLLCGRDKDDVLGFVHIKDLLRLPEDTPMSKITPRPIIAVPEKLAVLKLLEMFKRNSTKIAVVVDEHGGTGGIVTMTDIVVEIVGDYDDEYPHKSNGQRIVDLGDGHFETDGSCHIDDFVKTAGIRRDDVDSHDTLGGLLFELFDSIPEAGDTIEYASNGKCIRFEVCSMEAYKIGRVEFQIAHIENGNEIDNTSGGDNSIGNDVPSDAQEGQ